MPVKAIIVLLTSFVVIGELAIPSKIGQILLGVPGSYIGLAVGCIIFILGLDRLKDAIKASYSSPEQNAPWTKRSLNKMPPDSVHITVGDDVVEVDKVIYDMTIAKFKNYHSLFWNLPLILIVPFLALVIQSWNLVKAIPYAPFWVIFSFIAVFGILYAIVSNKFSDTEEFLYRGCRECLIPKTLQQEILDFFKALGRSWTIIREYECLFQPSLT